MKTCTFHFLPRISLQAYLQKCHFCGELWLTHGHLPRQTSRAVQGLSRTASCHGLGTDAGMYLRKVARGVLPKCEVVRLFDPNVPMPCGVNLIVSEPHITETLWDREMEAKRIIYFCGWITWVSITEGIGLFFFRGSFEIDIPKKKQPWVSLYLMHVPCLGLELPAGAACCAGRSKDTLAIHAFGGWEWRWEWLSSPTQMQGLSFPALVID